MTISTMPVPSLPVIGAPSPSPVSGPNKTGNPEPNPGANQNPSAVSREQSFERVLSRQLAGQREQRMHHAAIQSDKAPASQAGKPAAAQDKAAPADKSAAAQECKPEQSAEKSGTENEASAQSASADTALPPDLAAMVASLMQLNGARTDTAKAQGAADHADADALLPDTSGGRGGRGLARDAAALHPDLGAEHADATRATGRDAASELPALAARPAADAKAFESVLQQAGPVPVEELSAPAVPVLQQTAAPALQAVQHAAQDRLAPQVGTPAWDQALGQKIVWMASGAEQTASLTLNPPDLGPLQVVVSVTNSQASAAFVAAQPEVRQALEAAMPRLREMLGEAGIELAQASVDSGASGRRDESAPSRQAFGGNGSNGAPVDGAVAGDIAARSGGARRLASGNGLVDTFV